MDLLRGTAMVLVVLLHAGLDAGGPDGQAFDAFLRPFRMPILMALSGLLLQHSLSKGLRTYTLGKLGGIVWPWALWMAVMVVILTQQARQDPVAFLTIGTNLWFLQALACAYALAWVLRPVPPAFVAVGLLLVAAPMQDRVSAIGTYAWYGAFFFMGAALRPVIDRWIQVRFGWPFALGVLAVAGGLSQVPRGLYVPYRLEDAAVSLAGILAAIWLAVRAPRVAPVRAVEWIGRNSMVTYLVHTALMEPVAGAILRRRLGDAPSMLLSFVLVMSGCLVMTAIRPWTGWLYQLPLSTWASARVRATAGPSGAG